MFQKDLLPKWKFLFSLIEFQIPSALENEVAEPNITFSTLPDKLIWIRTKDCGYRERLQLKWISLCWIPALQSQRLILNLTVQLTLAKRKKFADIEASRENAPGCRNSPEFYVCGLEHSLLVISASLILNQLERDWLLIDYVIACFWE